jgi:N-acetylglucosaminyl-diphospho-decaprenol L-rhamnosyltransferase
MPVSSHGITISIVSHQQAALVRELLGDLDRFCRASVSDVLLTANVPEVLPFRAGDFGLRVSVVTNADPRGFGANHNAAFRRSTTASFCVLNPDIRLQDDPFPALAAELAKDRVGVAAPLIVDPHGRVEDSARRFPTVGRLVSKALGGARPLDYDLSEGPVSPDWVAGMFMLFRAEAFSAVHGFDERYFLYYEDVDLCRRLRQRGYDVRVVPEARAVHAARRASRRSLRHLRWHLSSMARYLARSR